MNAIHALASLQAVAQGAGVVPQGLDDQAQQGFALVAGAQGAGRAGDGEGVGAFAMVETHKGELPGAVARPAGGQRADHLDGRRRAAA